MIETVAIYRNGTEPGLQVCCCKQRPFR